MSKEKIKVYLYTRVSTAMQIDGYSLEAQKTKMKAYCDYNEYEIAGEYEDAGKSGKSIEGEGYLKRVSGGVLADGVNSFIAGIFNSFPNSIFAQNNGIIQLTGVASRYVGYYIAGMLILLGLFPIVGVVFSLMPDPVLGGATLLMFGTVAAAGIRIIASQEINRKATLVLAVSLSLGLGVELMPDILKTAPDAIKGIFASGITTGGLTAIVANVFIRVKEDKEDKTQ